MSREPKLKIINPSVFDILFVAMHMDDEEKRQYEAATGAPFDGESCARAIISYRGVEYGMVDEQGTCICVFGAFEVVRGVYQTWMLNTPAAFGKHPRDVTTLARKTMHAFLEMEGVRRIQTYACDWRENACRWYEKGLGMEPEGVQRSFYHDGSGAAVFSLTR